MEALVEFIQKEMKDPVQVVGSITEVFDKVMNHGIPYVL